MKSCSRIKRIVLQRYKNRKHTTCCIFFFSLFYTIIIFSLVSKECCLFFCCYFFKVFCVDWNWLCSVCVYICAYIWGNWFFMLCWRVTRFLNKKICRIERNSLNFLFIFISFSEWKTGKIYKSTKKRIIFFWLGSNSFSSFRCNFYLCRRREFDNIDCKTSKYCVRYGNRFNVSVKKTDIFSIQFHRIHIYRKPAEFGVAIFDWFQ